MYRFVFLEKKRELVKSNFIISGSAKAAKALLERNANINAQDSSGMAPLHWVCIKQKKKILKDQYGAGLPRYIMHRMMV